MIYASDTGYSIHTLELVQNCHPQLGSLVSVVLGHVQHAERFATHAGATHDRQQPQPAFATRQVRLLCPAP